MATAALDAHVTVKQHGFHVKQPLQHPPAAAASWPEAAAAAASKAAASGGGPVAASAEASPSDHAMGAESPFGRGEGSLRQRGLLNFSTPCSASTGATVAAATATAADGTPVMELPPGSGCLLPADAAHLTPGVKRLMKGVVRGLKAFQEPERATEGLGGTYFFTNEAGQKIGIMKPCDEEPLAPNNPKGFVGRQLGEPGLKPTVRVGEAASREVAAYLLDHDRFARVPHTVMVKMTHPIFHVTPSTTQPRQQQQPQLASASSGRSSSGGSDSSMAGAEGVPAALGEQEAGALQLLQQQLPCKLGSLQQFVAHECDTSEMGASRFSVRDVQRIGIFDIRLFNTDRHAGNMLVRRPPPRGALPGAHVGAVGASFGGGAGAAPQRLDGAALLELAAWELIPIDHGFALPEALEPPYFEWQHWPQAMLPFGREELEYIAALDAKADIRMLRQEVPSLRIESLRVLEVCTTLLQACAAAGLTLAEIAGVATRPLIGMDEEPSELERICFNARAEVEELTDDELEAEGLAGAVAGRRAGGIGAIAEAAEEGESEEEGFVAMLSVDDEADGADLASPTSCSSGASSDNTAFKMSLMSLTASEASRLEEADLFSMDEDSAGAAGGGGGEGRTPPRARSPSGVLRLPASRFAAEAAGKGGAAAGPHTPAAAGLAVSFVSPLSAGGLEDSLATSFSSMGLRDISPDRPQAISVAGGNGGSMAGSSSAFYGASSYAPATCHSRAPPGGSGAGGGPPRKSRSRRKLAIGSRLLKLTTQNYPPLVESRGGHSSEGALAVFRDLSEEQWERFMQVVRCQVARKLRDGAWKLAAAPKGAAPGMSCPRF